MVIGTLESHLAGPFISMQVTGIEIFTRLWWLLLRTIPEWPGGGEGRTNITLQRFCQQTRIHHFEQVIATKLLEGYREESIILCIEVAQFSIG